jgi:hypothetical protein
VHRFTVLVSRTLGTVPLDSLEISERMGVIFLSYFSSMLISVATLLATLSSILRSRAAFGLENPALRHPIGVLQKSARKTREICPRGTCAYRNIRAYLPGLRWLKTRSVVHYNQDEGTINVLVVWPTIQILLSAKGLFFLPRVRLWQPHCFKPVRCKLRCRCKQRSDRE